MGEDETNDLSDDSTSDESDVALLFNEAAAVVKAGMAAPSSDEDDDDNDDHQHGGRRNRIQLYYTGEPTAHGGRDSDAKIIRAARERKRRAERANLNSDDEDEESFVPRSQTKKTPTRTGGRDRPTAAASAQREVVSLLNNDSLMNSSDEEEEVMEEESAPYALTAVLDAETSHSKRATHLHKIASSSRQQQLHRPPVDVDVDVDDDDVQSSQQRWITVMIDGTNDSAAFTLQENNSVKDVIAMCVERFKMEANTPMGMYHENRLLHPLDLLFEVPERCTLLARVHRKIHINTIVKDVPKGTMIRLTLRGPAGDKVVKIGSLQPLQVAFDQYGAGKGLRFDGDKLLLDSLPGVYGLQDEDLVDVV